MQTRLVAYFKQKTVNFKILSEKKASLFPARPIEIASFPPQLKRSQCFILKVQFHEAAALKNHEL